MQNIDEIRQRILKRLEELNLEAAVVSIAIGKNRGYLHDFLRKGSPKMLPNDTTLKLAKELRVSPAEIGAEVLVAAGGEFADEPEARPYVPGPNQLRPPAHIGLFQSRSRALDAHPRGITPGKIVGFNLNNTDPARIPAGTVVVVQLYDRNALMKSHGTVFRQFFPPDKLVTNSTGPNDIMKLDDLSRPYICVIKGTLSYVVDPIEDDDAGHAT